MTWLHPTFWWALLAAPLVAGAFWWAARRYRQTLRRLGHPALIEQLTPLVSPRRRRWKAAFATAAVALMALALMGPRYGIEERTARRQGVDLVIALDVSVSMQAEDVAPSRLQRARHEIETLLDRLEGHRVGLVLFAGDAFVQCPLTTDYSAVRLFLDAATPASIPTPGTNFQAAFAAARRAFEASGDTDPPGETPRAQALLFVSDGENHVGEIEAVKRAAEETGITIFAAGVGTNAGAPIPVYDAAGRRTSYKHNEQGEIVTTRLEEKALRTLAASGAYFRVAATGSALPRLEAALRRLPQMNLGSERFAAYREQYQWPLALALLLLAAERLIRLRRT